MSGNHLLGGFRLGRREGRGGTVVARFLGLKYEKQQSLYMTSHTPYICSSYLLLISTNRIRRVLRTYIFGKCLMHVAIVVYV